MKQLTGLVFFLLLFIGCTKRNIDTYPIYTDYGNGVLLFRMSDAPENLSKFVEKDGRKIIAISDYYDGQIIVIVENTPEKQIR